MITAPHRVEPRLRSLPQGGGILLSEIDTEDRRYRITSQTDTAGLRACIEALGLLSAPVLEETGSGFAVVSGFRRISACGALGWDRIPAAIIDSTVPEVIRMKTAIAENALQRPLNLVEQATALQKLSRFYGDPAKLAKEAGPLGLPDNPRLIGKLLEISRLSGTIQGALLSGSVFLPTALELGSLEEASAVALVRLFDDLRPGLNRQREILSLACEIAAREGISVKDILQEEPVRNLLNPEDPDRPQRIRRLRDYLKKRRFPRITEAEEAFNGLIRSLHLGNDISLIPPEGFEGTAYVLTLRFAGLDQLKKQREKMDRMIEDPGFQSLFS